MSRFYVLALLLAAAWPATAQERVFNTYGFFDLEYEQSNKDEAGRRGTFDQHHFNVVSSFILDDRFRVFSEIEWEHGAEVTEEEVVGVVRVERAWVEYKHSDLLKIRGGKFLTPYGIYNISHDATPTFLSTLLPVSIYGKHRNPAGQKQRLYAKFSTGLQVLGTVFTDAWHLDYVGQLSNGQGAQEHKADDNANKALSTRLIFSLTDTELQLGTSFYTEENGDASHARQQSLAFDARYDLGPLQLSAESAFGRLERYDGGQPNDTFQKTLGYYGQAAYVIGGRITPFVRYERFDPDTGSAQDLETVYTAGINVSVTPRVYLKAEVHHFDFAAPSSSYEMFLTSIAVAF